MPVIVFLSRLNRPIYLYVPTLHSCVYKGGEVKLRTLHTDMYLDLN